MSPQGRGIYDDILTLSQFSRSSEYLVVDEGGATRNGCWHRPGMTWHRHGADLARPGTDLARHGTDMAPTWHDMAPTWHDMAPTWRRPGTTWHRHGIERSILNPWPLVCLPSKGHVYAHPGGFKCPRDGTCMPVVTGGIKRTIWARSINAGGYPHHYLCVAGSSATPTHRHDRTADPVPDDCGVRTLRDRLGGPSRSRTYVLRHR
jgi:hypothetical protein